MTPQDDFDRTFSAWLHERAQPYAPDHLRKDAPDRAMRVRPRPAWRIPERWIPMPVTLRLALVPRAVMLLMLLALAIALATAGMVVGSRLHLFATVQLPPPVGLAGNGLIAYSSDGDIWVVNPDGTDRRRLTSGPAYDFDPTWSRDGARLAHWSKDSESDTLQRLIVMDADGSDPVRVGTYDHKTMYDPSQVDWSPDGTRLAYSVCRSISPCGEQVIVAKTDGSGFAPVGDPSLRAWEPAWSPDGSRIAFGGGDGQDKGVYVMARDGSDVRRLSDVTDASENSFIAVDWSSVGDRIVTQASPTGGEYRLWSFAPDGDEEWQVPGTPPGSILARWSPDGTRISFWVAEGSERHVSVIPADGGDVTRLASDLENDWSWSPDGTRLVGRRAEPSGLVVLDATTGESLWEHDIAVHALSWQRVASGSSAP
jgi:TolB protein